MMQLQFLWLCPICLVLAAIFIAVERTERYVEADVIKGAASLTFVLLGFLGMLSHGRESIGTYSILIEAGLVIGAIADVVLNLRYVFEGAKGKLAFLVGILIFLLGHIAYLAAVAPLTQWLLAVAIAGIAATVVLMVWILRQVEASFAFKAFGCVYIGAIVVLNFVALARLIQAPSAHTTIFFSGALLFLVSDIILVLNTFGPKSRFSWRVANLMLYYVGQLLIALSLQLI